MSECSDPGKTTTNLRVREDGLLPIDNISGECENPPFVIGRKKLVV
jgi:hypothetical protein